MDQDDLLPVDTESGFAQAIREHLALKTRNADLDGDMPIDRYLDGDPLENHPLFKSEEQARIEETMDGEPAAELSSDRLPWPGEETVENVDDAENSRGRRARRSSLDGASARLRLGRLTDPPAAVVNPAERLRRYAELAVRVGANVQPGQDVVVMCLVEHAEIARAVIREAYRAGAQHVVVLYSDLAPPSRRDRARPRE